MQTLIFDTTKKQAILLNGPRGSSTVIESFRDVSTVKVNVAHYEVMQKIGEDLDWQDRSAIPVMRVPISNTNMKHILKQNENGDFIIIEESFDEQPDFLYTTLLEHKEIWNKNFIKDVDVFKGVSLILDNDFSLTETQIDDETYQVIANPIIKS